VSNTGNAPAAALSKAAPKAQDLLAQHQKTFDELDFDVYSNQMWGRLQESHADDILVIYPDGPPEQRPLRRSRRCSSGIACLVRHKLALAAAA
jgi:hypothetical protein